MITLSIITYSSTLLADSAFSTFLTDWFTVCIPHFYIEKASCESIIEIHHDALQKLKSLPTYKEKLSVIGRKEYSNFQVTAAIFSLYLLIYDFIPKCD